MRVLFVRFSGGREGGRVGGMPSEVNVGGNRLLGHEFRNEGFFTYDLPHRILRGGVVLIRVTGWLDVKSTKCLRGGLRLRSGISPATVHLFVWLGKNVSACGRLQQDLE